MKLSLFHTCGVRDWCSKVRSSAFCCSRLCVSARSSQISVSVTLGIQEPEGWTTVENLCCLSGLCPCVLTDTVLVLSLPRPKVSAYPLRAPCWYPPSRPELLKPPCESSWDVRGLPFPLEKNNNTVWELHCRQNKTRWSNLDVLQVLLGSHDLLEETLYCRHQMLRISEVTADLRTGNKWDMWANQRESVSITHPRALCPPQPVLGGDV